MSEHSNGITLSPGASLTFAAAQGEVEWRLRNTERGLGIEVVDERDSQKWRSILRLTPRGVFITGTLTVDGEIKQDFDPDKFVGTWEVIAGSIPNKKDKYHAIIDREDDKFILTYSYPGGRPSEHRYVLRYNPRTRTLDGSAEENGGRPSRSISFWDGRRTGGDGRHKIYAIRQSEVIPASGADGSESFFPWELHEDGTPLTGDNGTWGATEGG